MDEISKRQLAIYAVAAVVIGVVGARYIGQGGTSPPPGVSGAAAPARSGQASVSVSGGQSASPVVDVTGAVRRPGVVRVRAGARVQEAVRRAGGPSRGADLSAVNLAAKVSDGAQIVVPRRSPSGAPAPAAGGAPAGPLNLNTASVEQLDALDGVGPSTAKKIVEYRRQHGGFGSVDELDQVPGIGAKKLADLRAKVSA